MIAALYVAKGGCYYGLDDVDPWDEERDARTYAGPWPVVAHPPCQRWGRYWYGGPMCHKRGTRKIKGDDDGCFAAALASVRQWGGVLEHPAASHAWRHFGLTAPPIAVGGSWPTRAAAGRATSSRATTGTVRARRRGYTRCGARCRRSCGGRHRRACGSTRGSTRRRSGRGIGDSCGHLPVSAQRSAQLDEPTSRLAPQWCAPSGWASASAPRHPSPSATYCSPWPGA